jgi:hypothetical protein
MVELDKSLYVAGLQCERRLWLAAREPERADPRTPSVEQRLARGRALGREARKLFPGGVEVAESGAAALERTRALLADVSIPALFEPAFEHAGIRVRVDVLERLADGAFGLREVKSATGVKEVDLDDAVLQLHVLRGAGLRVPSVEIVHVNSSYRRGTGPVEWPHFFVRRDVTEDAEFLLADVPARATEFIAALRGACPEIEPSPHCRRPHVCEFWGSCTRAKPATWIGYLPGLQGTTFHALREAGIERADQIPGSFALTPAERRARSAHRGSGRCVAPSLASALAQAGPPAHYLDFECATPAVPLFQGTGPYAPIAFQWSLHSQAAESAPLAHREFLADGAADPRRAFAESLLAALTGDTWPVVVYSAFEGQVLGDLAGALPDLAADLRALARRLFDLLPVVRGGVYDVGFGGSFSIKRVAPALVPGFGYGDLAEVADGGRAAELLEQLGRGVLAHAAPVRAALLAYCARDTLALAAVHRALRALAADSAHA